MFFKIFEKKNPEPIKKPSFHKVRPLAKLRKRTRSLHGHLKLQKSPNMPTHWSNSTMGLKFRQIQKTGNARAVIYVLICGWICPTGLYCVVAKIGTVVGAMDMRLNTITKLNIHSVLNWEQLQKTAQMYFLMLKMIWSLIHIWQRFVKNIYYSLFPDKPAVSNFDNFQL